MNPKKLQPHTARIGERPARGLSGLLWKNLVVECRVGDSNHWVEIARMGDQLTEDHQRRIAEAIVETVRKL